MAGLPCQCLSCVRFAQSEAEAMAMAERKECLTGSALAMSILPSSILRKERSRQKKANCVFGQFAKCTVSDTSCQEMRVVPARPCMWRRIDSNLCACSNSGTRGCCHTCEFADKTQTKKARLFALFLVHANLAGGQCIYFWDQTKSCPRKRSTVCRLLCGQW